MLAHPQKSPSLIAQLDETVIHQKRFSVLSENDAVSFPDTVVRHHEHAVGANQCSSAVVQEISAPVSSVWSVVRRFDHPEVYKHFVKSCHVIVGDGDVGTLREVRVISGLPAASSTERLEILDEERHVISFSVVGGDHRLANYRSVTSLHESDGGEGTVVVESYAVDIPPGNTKDETRHFVDTIVRCNLQSLAKLSESLVSKNGVGLSRGVVIGSLKRRRIWSPLIPCNSFGFHRLSMSILSNIDEKSVRTGLVWAFVFAAFFLPLRFGNSKYVRLQLHVCT